MKNLVGTSLAAVAALVGTVAITGTAHAASPESSVGGADHVVFVQTDNTAGNQVVAYDRSGNGTLTLANTYATGGLGGSLSGSVVDHLASQGSLTYDQGNHLLYAVNAGSNTVSVFSVRGDQLTLQQVVNSGGTFPVSVAVHNGVVYVLNAENGGALQEYFALFGHLLPIPGSNRALGLNPSATPQFTNTPGQVAFSPDGSKLIVTTKANGNDIDVYRVGFLGLLSPSPVVNAEPNTVPFGVTFDAAGHLVVAESSSTNPALGTFTLNQDGTVTPVDTVGTGQTATCWVTTAQGYFFASNAGSASISSFQASPSAQLTLLGQTTTDPGTVDASPSADGQFLYVQTGGNGIVDEFHVNPGGSLTEIGSVTVPGSVAGEGIVAF
ncbi:MAG TPA: beta-propeller fold lactonase family protein [Acidimicrobiales bacterium]